MKMKSIEYRGGVVLFRIPAHWVEEYEASGGGTFFEDRVGAPTLHLNVVTLEAPQPATPELVEAMLRGIGSERSGVVERLPNGNTLLSFEEAGEEGGTQIQISYWCLGQPLPPKNARLAKFSLTTLKSQRENVEIVDLLRILKKEIVAAQFAKRMGVSGDWKPNA